MVHIEGLSKSFGKVSVLKQVDLHLPAGECIALIGPNGCGKTTLIKSILGMVIPNTGKIKVKEKLVTRDFAYRNHIGYMPQIGHYPDNMSIRQVTDMIIGIRNQKESTLDKELLDSFGLQELGFKKMNTLSGGTTQKVSATLAFLFNPDILILDEPTAGLDPLAAEILKQKIIREKEKGKLILITSHLLSELDDLVTRIIFMQEGHVLLHQSVKELQEKTNTHSISQAIISILKNNIHAQNS